MNDRVSTLWLPCFAAMLAGLAVDTSVVAPEALLAMCTAPGVDPAAFIARAWRLMPATHASMWCMAAGAVLYAEARAASAGRALRIVRRGVCVCAMECGMWLGMALAARLVASPNVPASTAIVLGMTIGMLLPLAPQALRAARYAAQSIRAYRLGTRPTCRWKAALKVLVDP
ncbi:hypothetical protein [Lysobacter terrae]